MESNFSSLVCGVDRISIKLGVRLIGINLLAIDLDVAGKTRYFLWGCPLSWIQWPNLPKVLHILHPISPFQIFRTHFRSFQSYCGGRWICCLGPWETPHAPRSSSTSWTDHGSSVYAKGPIVAPWLGNDRLVGQCLGTSLNGGQFLVENFGSVVQPWKNSSHHLKTLPGREWFTIGNRHNRRSTCP